MRRFVIVVGLAIAIIAAAVVAGVLYVRSAGPALDGVVHVDGITAPVEIWRDSMGVPHIWAETEEDLFFAQGFVHAQDRLWQLELFRRVAEGRLSEVLGEEMVSTDIFLRTVGVWRAAEAQEKLLDDEAKTALSAYVAGVNAAIDGWSGPLPPELLALGIRPEPWTLRHALAMERIMAWDLTLYVATAELARTAARLDSATLRALYEPYPEWGPTILEPPPIPGPAALLLDALSITRASNAWVIGGSRTRSGKPILANDMHLALRAPSLWYLMALHGGRYDVVGMTLPGVAFVIAGHNRAIAWGYTNAMLDDADAFIERIDPQDSTRYLVPGGSEPFQVLEEHIRVKGLDTAVVARILLTRHGPVMPDQPRSNGEVIALRWGGHDPSRSVTGLPAMNRAADWESFVRAVDDFDNPHQNIVYADTAGNFGYVMGGRIPARPEGRRPPILAVPGWTGEWDWNGYLDFSLHPRALNPPSGFIVTANNKQAAGEVAELISSDWEQPYRAARIREMILEASDVDADAVHRMQLDVRDLMAARYRDVAAGAFEAAGLVASAAVLREWNLEATTDSHAAALFYPWYDTMRRLTRANLLGDEGVLPRKAMNVVLDSGSFFWQHDGRAAFDSTARAAAVEAERIAAGRTWGELHSVVAEHPLAAAKLLDRLIGLNVGPAPAGGSPTTVNVSHYFTSTTYPVISDYGPSQRHVVDMGDVDGAGGFILPTGQSGIPFSPHYADQWPLWLRGGLWRIPLDRAAAEARTVHRQVLQPADR